MEYAQYLEKAGLTPHEAALYEVLVREGALVASRAASLAKVPRTLAYQRLEDLRNKGFIEKEERKGRAHHYKAVHPQKLKDAAEARRKQAVRAISSLNTVMSELTSAFNLASGRPGVKFFEGRVGVRKVFDDSLTATETILAYSDVVSIQKELSDINVEYIQRRLQKQVRKKFLMPDSRANRKSMQQSSEELEKLTDVRFMNLDNAPFGTMMQIYDNKVSHITFEEGKLIGIIIEDAFIYDLNKKLFNYIWNTANE